jgi:omega-6 fatty acid desaturase (delta-12 desaturase)
MASAVAPTKPTTLIQRLRAINAAELAAHLPAECFRPSPIRGFAAIARSTLLLLLSLGGLRYAPWWSYPLFWLGAGTAAWGWLVIAHDCGHHAFARRPWVNTLVGHLLMTPWLYPFHSWRLLHNLHHAHTNSRERDNNWVPPTAAELAAQPPHRRLLYRALRRHLWWTATAVNWALEAFRTGTHSTRGARDVRFSIALVALFVLLFLPLGLHTIGWRGLLHYYGIPWLLMHAWFSTITLMHHTHPELPYLDRAHWSRAGANLGLTVYYRYPRWLEWLMHNITVHSAHHVAPKIPFFHLPAAQTALQRAYPGLVRSEAIHWRHLREILRGCHLHQPESLLYHAFGRRQVRGDRIDRGAIPEQSG